MMGAMTQQLDTSAVPSVVLEAGRRFADAGHDLSLVGGPVRDLFLGRVATDLDFTTDAGPDAAEAVEGTDPAAPDEDGDGRFVWRAPTR